MANQKIKNTTKKTEVKEVVTTKEVTQEVGCKNGLTEIQREALKLTEEIGMKAFNNALALSRNKRLVQNNSGANLVKTTFSAEFIEFISKIYANRMILCNMVRVFSSNQKSYMNAIEEHKKNITEKSVNGASEEKLDVLQEELREKELVLKQLQTAYQYARRKNIKTEKDLLKKVADELEELHVGYTVMRIDGGKSYYEKIKKFLGVFYMNMNDTIFSYFRDLIGVKSAPDSKVDERFYKPLSQKEFTKLFMNLLLELALEKQQISKRHVEAVYDPKIIQDFTQYCDKVVVIEPKKSTTANEYKEILSSIGIDYKSNSSKEELINLYKMALEKDLFIEIER